MISENQYGKIGGKAEYLERIFKEDQKLGLTKSYQLYSCTRQADC